MIEATSASKQTNKVMPNQAYAETPNKSSPSQNQKNQSLRQTTPPPPKLPQFYIFGSKTKPAYPERPIKP
jgi:hypothetical protein